MPESPDPKIRPHPWETNADVMARPRRFPAGSCHRYAELHVTSNFTFLTGASHPEELVEQAAALGHHAIAIADRNSVAGIVRAHVAAKGVGIPLVVGCRLAVQLNHHDHQEELSILVYPTGVESYGRLCRLLTIGKRRGPKGACHLVLHDLIEHNRGLLAIVIPPGIPAALVPGALDQTFIEAVQGLKRHFDDDRLSIAASCLYGPDDRERLSQLAALSAHLGVPLVATNDVHYHIPQRRPLQDVLTCVRHGCTLQNAGFRLFAHAERCLKPPQEMARLFTQHPQALARTVDIAQRATAFNLDALRYQYPDEVCPPGLTPMQHLIELTRCGARHRYPNGVPERVRTQIEHELKLIEELNYAPYFLTVYDLVMFARSRGILCQGRGAAANSTVCYCLGITAVDPERIDLLFERFISRQRNEPPDIDIDFEHERREEVIQYIYRKYGRDRAALTAEVITYRGRSAVRDVGKAFGLALDCVDRMAKNIDWWSDRTGKLDRLRQIGLNPNDPTIRQVMALSNAILGFPRHLSQHVGGFVITRGPLCEMVPIENAAMPNRTVIEWDKDDIDAMGMLKVDVLGLGMLTCVRKAFDLVKRHHGRSLSLATVPAKDPSVYDMICEADTIGVFQIESRAQMTMRTRLRPRCFYDLVIEVAIVRPGPIQGDMVHPYLRRRNGQEPVTYPTDQVKRVLGKTLGVPLFQEQAMALAVVAAGFTPDEADQLRRAMAAWKRRGNQIERFETKFTRGMVQRGYERAFADRCFNQLKGFSEYGFPESHAASFALIVYVSAWLKKHYPAAFAAALINSQPMGFYAPAQIVRDAAEHGVEVRPVDLQCSQWDCTLQETHGSDQSPALRLGMRLVSGLQQQEAIKITQAVQRHGRFDSIEALWRAAGVSKVGLRKLASADAFGSMGLDRQAALWHVRALNDDHLPMFEDLQPQPVCRQSALPAILPAKQVLHDYAALGLSLKAHPVAFLRELLNRRGVTPASELQCQERWPHGTRIAVAGLALVRQRPATAAGLVFITLEDETGIANLIVRPKVYERYRTAARHGVVILARGTIERQGAVVHVLTAQLESLDGHLAQLTARSRDFR
ncbi:MAG: error-prone DNA polymerase [Planctomycetota bacterium]|nr:error-prone DNA polymerase [Planctomycetota bacterium]